MSITQERVVQTPLMRNAGVKRFASHTLILLITSTSLSQTALAQSAVPGSSTALEPIVLESGQKTTTGWSNGVMDRMAGGVTLVQADSWQGVIAPTLSDVLAGVPGVVVQDFFCANDQPRIQIRGSGLQQNPVERGILMLHDGLPINRADGSYIVGLANPSTAQGVEVYRGYMANRLGATVLGGAMNFMSPPITGAPGVEISTGGGSFGQVGGTARANFGDESLGASIYADATRRDGFRDYNSSERVSFGGSFVAELSDVVTTRVFFDYTDLGFDVAGPINKAALDSDPSQVSAGPVIVGGVATNPGPNVLRDKPRRDATQVMLGSRTTIDLGEHRIDLGLGYTHTDDSFRFPVSAGIRETVGGDLTGMARYSYAPDGFGDLPLFETSALYTIGSADRRYYLNESGTRGSLFGENDLDASSLSLHAGFNIPVADGWTVSPAISYAHASRRNSDTYSSATRPTIAYNPMNPTVRLPNGAITATDTSYDRSYTAWSPSLGVTFEPSADHIFFAAISRSFEPPTHDDLLATINGTPNSSPGRPAPANPSLPSNAFITPALEAQTATTLEGGWRGQTGRVGWDLTTYYSWIDNELLSLRDATGAPIGAINADRTRHFGIEIGLSTDLTDRLTGRIAYTFQDFRFVDDPLRGDNYLAGAPRHIVNLALAYQATDDWTISTSLKWVPDETPVDNMNTLWADPYAVIDLKTEYRINDKLSIFGEITNLFDEKYASSTLVVDQATAGQAAYIPGDGRGFYAGLRSRF
ncbi:TonB-dependent receptor family protein [Rhizobium sp. ZW T2_16]|uniref:TonB-dependent receptor family protein n=1 Tax=Rhizobium sp. ZW T2_16 TaxID=3378083 RepID=UPI0038551A55